jgi:hypothetical protein
MGRPSGSKIIPVSKLGELDRSPSDRARLLFAMID